MCHLYLFKALTPSPWTKGCWFPSVQKGHIYSASGKMNTEGTSLTASETKGAAKEEPDAPQLL